MRHNPQITLLAAVLLSVILLSGCVTGSQAVKNDPPAVVPVEQAADAAAPSPASLDEDTLLLYLTAEIAAQRGKLQLAYDYYLQVARTTDDVYAARRATRIGLFLKNDLLALDAARLWVSSSPESVQALNTLMILSLRAAQLEQAGQLLEQMYTLAERTDKDGYLIAALSLSKEKQQAEAEQLMVSFVKNHAGDSRAYNALGVLQAAYKHYDSALQNLALALEYDPANEAAKLLSVRILVEQEKNAQAISFLERALVEHADHFELGLIYARLLVSVDHARAYSEFERLHRLQPENANVLSALGILAVQLDDIAAARGWWTALLDAGDRDQRSDAAYQLGQLAELAGNSDLAASYYEQVNHGSSRIEARIRLARLRADKGDIDNARDIFKQLRVLHPDQDTDYYLAEVQILSDHLTRDEVLAFYQQALAARPGNQELLYSRGLYASDEGLIDLAEQDFRLILEQKPNDADTLNALGYTLADQTERYQEAFELIKAAYDMKPDNAAILDSMGWVNYRLGNFELALSYLQKAIAKSNDDEIAAHLGEVLWVSGETGRAREVWQRALKDFPGSTKLSEVMRRLDN